MIIKALVFKTSQLKATREFFQHHLQVPLSEISARHFVITVNGLRIVFMESNEDLSIEIYTETDRAINLSQVEDPNGIKVILTSKNTS
jgi:hypothetical protein